VPIARCSKPAAALAVLVAFSALAVAEQPDDGPPRPAERERPEGPQPFGSQLFLGNFSGQAKDGVNPDYEVMTGDRVAVNTWGAVEINQVFTVDGQGNIFLPGVGPVRIGGVRNADLTNVVQQQIGRIYTRNVGVYTNLLTAAPVGVYVTGGVERPGRYAGVPSDSVLYFLDQAGGIDVALGSYRNIVILRGEQKVAEVDLYAFLLGGSLPAVQFAEGDTIVVRRRGPMIEVSGDVAVHALIELGEPPNTGADALEVVPHGALATQVTVRGNRDGRGFLNTLSVDEFRRTPLRDGDAISFRDDLKPDTILVHLEGEFEGPSTLSVYRGTRLLDALNYVEVNPEFADVSSVHLRRPSVATAQRKSIEDSLFRLERSALLALSHTDTETAIRVQEAELMRAFIESARTIQPLGRVVTAVDDRQLNILLQDGDTIVIPERSNVVRVSGEVQMAHAFVYSEGMSAEDYIARAGGYTDRSETRQVIVLRPDASVAIGNPRVHVRPGDEILVPPKVDRKLLQNTADVTRVLYQIAVAAAVVISVF
jgi:protein involved in polysaccharide export with SLBB domain